MPVVSLNNLSAKYRKTVLEDITLEAGAGSCIGLLGLNGSGKSTLLSVIAGVKKPASGTVKTEGKIGFVTQENALIDELNALDNILMWTDKTDDEVKEALRESELSVLKVADFLEVPVKNMSGGMKKRLAIASVLITGPEILLLDEPLAALDLTAKRDILKFIDDYKSRGNIVFIASHEEQVFAHCDRVYLLKSGKVSPVDNDSAVIELLND